MTKPVRYAFTGSRVLRDTYMIQLLLSGMAWWKKIHREKIEILVGDCPRGVDLNVHHIALDMGLHPRAFKADWSTPAGAVQRNQEIIDAGPKVVFAIKDDFGTRRNKKGRMLGGTEDCARRAIKAGIPVYLIRRLTEEDVT